MDASYFKNRSQPTAKDRPARVGELLALLPLLLLLQFRFFLSPCCCRVRASALMLSLLLLL